MARREDAAAETVSCLVLFPSTDISVHARSLRNLYATHSGVLDFVSFDMHRTKPVPPTTQATPPGVPIQVVVNTFKVRLNIDPKTGAQTKYYHYDGEHSRTSWYSDHHDTDEIMSSNRYTYLSWSVSSAS